MISLVTRDQQERQDRALAGPWDKFARLPIRASPITVECQRASAQE